MPRWTVDAPATYDFDRVDALRVRTIGGTVAVLSTGERACLDISAVTGQPLVVSHSDGTLTVSYEDLSWDGLLGWLRPDRTAATITITVPKDCPVQLGVVTASAVVSGISAATSVKSVSGAITLDGVTGAVDARTVSGDIEAQGLGGTIGFNSVSGDLTLADGSVDRLDAKTVSGRVTADIDLDQDAALRVATVSGPVAIRLPADARARVDLRSTTGRVLSEFPGLQHSEKPGASTISGDLGPAGHPGSGPGQHHVWPGHAAPAGTAWNAAGGGRGGGRQPMSPVFRHGRLRLYLLKLLDESPRHGYEVIRLLQDRFMGVYAPSPGTIYPRLARLEEEGLVTHDEADGRKVYRITDKGREELRNRSDDLSELEDEITASVRDIAREVTEDVRETVRNLREELTFAARDMHRRGAAPPRSAGSPRTSAAAPAPLPPGHQAPPRGNGAPPPRRGPGAASAWDEALQGRQPSSRTARQQDARHEEDTARGHPARPGAAGASRPGPGRGGPGPWSPPGLAGLAAGRIRLGGPRDLPGPGAAGPPLHPGVAGGGGPGPGGE